MNFHLSPTKWVIFIAGIGLGIVLTLYSQSRRTSIVHIAPNSPPLVISPVVLTKYIQTADGSDYSRTPIWNGRVGSNLFHIASLSKDGTQPGGWGNVGESIIGFKLQSYDTESKVLVVSDEQENVFRLTMIASKREDTDIVAFARDTAKKILLSRVEDIIREKSKLSVSAALDWTAIETAAPDIRTHFEKSRTIAESKGMILLVARREDGTWHQFERNKTARRDLPAYISTNLLESDINDFDMAQLIAVSELHIAHSKQKKLEEVAVLRESGKDIK